MSDSTPKASLTEQAARVVAEKFRRIQRIDDRPIDRAFDWPPDALIEEIARRLDLEQQLADQMAANENMVREKDQLSVELATLKARYAFHENQRLCDGYDGKCDGDLDGMAHEHTCPARTQDLILRPHLYGGTK